MKNWKIPTCLIGSSVDDAETLETAKWLASIELDLIEEQQDGTENYSPADIASIKRFCNE